MRPVPTVIGSRYGFSASHMLEGLPAGHKCGRLHGHGYTVEVEVEAADGELRPPGFVTDFADLAPFRDYLRDRFDHRHLNDVGVLEDQPTSENLARHFFGWCEQHLNPVIGGRVTAVTVSESEFRTWARYEPGPR